MLISSQKVFLRFPKGAVDAANAIKKPGKDDGNDGNDGQGDKDMKDPGNLYDADD